RDADAHCPCATALQAWLFAHSEQQRLSRFAARRSQIRLWPVSQLRVPEAPICWDAIVGAQQRRSALATAKGIASNRSSAAATRRAPILAFAAFQNSVKCITRRNLEFAFPLNTSANIFITKISIFWPPSRQLFQ
ncbi:MAG: hypothetical protein KGQ94_15765, partial [Alphaproteobacteria bacterium]|nr:hypothetical protein [Alphaproteobacteria bacterium]